MSKRRFCKSCKGPTQKQQRGRPSQYCSAACRQAAYRKRLATPHYALKKLFARDLRTSATTTGGIAAAIRYLESHGYVVTLNPALVREAREESTALIEKVKSASATASGTVVNGTHAISPPTDKRRPSN